MIPEYSIELCNKSKKVLSKIENINIIEEKIIPLIDKKEK